MLGVLEVTGIVTGPLTLTDGFAGLTTFRFAAVGLLVNVAVVREKGLLATPTQPFSDALHDPVPPGQSSNIMKQQGRKGLTAGRKRKRRVGFTNYEEEPEAEEDTFSKRRPGGTFRPPVTDGRGSRKVSINARQSRIFIG
jgi:hypothetical protein